MIPEQERVTERERLTFLGCLVVSSCLRWTWQALTQTSWPEGLFKDTEEFQIIRGKMVKVSPCVQQTFLESLPGARPRLCTVLGFKKARHSLAFWARIGSTAIPSPDLNGFAQQKSVSLVTCPVQVGKGAFASHSLSAILEGHHLGHVASRTSRSGREIGYTLVLKCL